MSKQYKWITLIAVGIAVLAILVMSNLEYFTADESTPADLATDDFKPTEQPLQVYDDARAEGKPIFLEFYAEW